MISRDPLRLISGPALERPDLERQAAALLEAWRAGRAVALAAAAEQQRLAEALAGHGFDGPGVVLGSGGSSGARRWLWQPLAHLEASARACGRWLAAEGVDPGAALLLNPLPLHHVSGLLPLLRAQLWGARHRFLAASQLRDPQRLAAEPLPAGRPVLLSLVPLQLQRLLAVPEAVDWLRGCRVIWLGGAALPADLAAAARRQGLPLAPCYGATETAAMVTALSPQRFLEGAAGCGPPLEDVALRLGGAADPAARAVEVRCQRLACGWLERGRLRPLPGLAQGWWRSGDAGVLEADGLRILGRLDGAILSGGETVFPEQLEARLLAQARRLELPLAAVLLLGWPESGWGERLVALVRPEEGADPEALLAVLAALTAAWPAAERPRRWQLCPPLAASAAGKWERRRWRQWLEQEWGEPQSRELGGAEPPRPAQR
ncbi:MAG: AMP-binding protein [Synechococcaceae cyanobacterium]|nr:AMP-binding protein [Synechococcaceae cyanobacterium]